MLDRPAAEATRSGLPPGTLPRWPFALMGAAGVLGAAGVAVGAAGAHLDVAGRHGADLARTASTFLMIHAAAVLAGSGVALIVGRGVRLVTAGLTLLVVGAVLFGGDLALLGLFDWHPVPSAAPTGGLFLIAGWLCLSAWAVTLALPRR
jgi:uncharacterized membrane protein YgdD (TMEM256/DUF423 family)